jgi:hypothetical protein
MWNVRVHLCNKRNFRCKKLGYYKASSNVTRYPDRAWSETEQLYTSPTMQPSICRMPDIWWTKWTSEIKWGPGNKWSAWSMPLIIFQLDTLKIARMDSTKYDMTCHSSELDTSRAVMKTMLSRTSLINFKKKKLQDTIEDGWAVLVKGSEFKFHSTLRDTCHFGAPVSRVCDSEIKLEASFWASLTWNFSFSLVSLSNPMPWYCSGYMTGLWCENDFAFGRHISDSLRQHRRT